MWSGAAAIPTARTTSTAVTARVAAIREGRSFSTAISIATTTIQAMLITPSANSAAIRAQQQPTHHAPCSIPMRSAPSRPSRHASRMNDSGPRQRVRQAFFNGVNS